MEQPPVVDGRVVKGVSDTLQEAKTEHQIIDRIYTLPEVKQFGKELGKVRRHLNIWISGKPEQNQWSSYWVNVGEDNGDALVTDFNFLVSKDMTTIRYYDAAADSAISLADWRKTRNNRK